MMVIEVLLSSEAVSWSEVDKVTNSIGKQREHHRVKTFKEEFLQFLVKHKVEYDLETI